ncbi:TrbI/VirB10 family protein, partial [Arthrospira platensis SPKY1]|nr:TrbI/VirB10 family protein [Arthrospira platensis SPKY1]
MVLEGTSVVVVMEDDVSSDIPGECRARVAQDVLDSVTQSMVLIPVHSRVICTYDTGVVHGQDKMLLAFTRLIYPNGASIALGGMDAHDRYGAAGAPAQVNSRFWRIFGSSLLIAAVTKLAEPKPQ